MQSLAEEKAMLEKYCNRAVDEAMTVISKSRPNFARPKLIFDWGIRRVSHMGGYYAKYKTHGINYAMRQFSIRRYSTNLVFYEYPSFAKDPEIGSYPASNIYQYIFILTLHEIAHCIQAFDANIARKKVLPHGDEFKQAYRDLRVAFNLVKPKV